MLLLRFCNAQGQRLPLQKPSLRMVTPGIDLHVSKRQLKFPLTAVTAAGRKPRGAARLRRKSSRWQCATTDTVLEYGRDALRAAL